MILSDDALDTWTDDTVWRSGSAAWRALRTMRPTPPGAAGKGARANVFRAGLEQAQQQITAAGSVGYESRPLNLFYGLSQAGRAIAAAATGLDSRSWDLRGHGITANPGINGVTLVEHFPTMRLDRDDNGGPAGSFIRLASVLSPGCDLSAGLTMQQLWASVLEAVKTQPLGDQCPPVVTLDPEDAQPENLFRGRVYMPADPAKAPGDITDDVARRFLADYPTLAGYRLRKFGPAWPAAWALMPNVRVSVLVNVCWPMPDVSLTARLAEELALEPFTTDYRGRRVVLPRFRPADTEPLHPLLTWWAILFGLSMLCRYRPVVWTDLIAINRSPYASAIEHLLDVGLDAVPDLIERTIRKVAT